MRNFGSHIGRAEVADEVVGPNFTELWISIDPKVDYNAMIDKVQAVMDSYPGLYRDVQTYLKERSKEVLTGTSASVVVRLYGPDLAVLRTSAKDVENEMKKVQAWSISRSSRRCWCRRSRFGSGPRRRPSFGLTAGHVRRAATTSLRGSKVGEVYEGQKSFEVVVWGVPELRGDAGDTSNYLADRHSCRPGKCRLGDVADDRDRTDAQRDQTRVGFPPAGHHLRRQGPRPGYCGPGD